MTMSTAIRILSLYLWRPFPLNAIGLYRLFRGWGEGRCEAARDAVRLAWIAAGRWRAILKDEAVPLPTRGAGR